MDTDGLEQSEKTSREWGKSGEVFDADQVTFPPATGEPKFWHWYPGMVMTFGNTVVTIVKGKCWVTIESQKPQLPPELPPSWWVQHWESGEDLYG